MRKNELVLFETFAKGRKKKDTDTKNCVIYTRVSTKEQADNNMSLGTQKKACEQYARKNGYQILGCFGGTYGFYGKGAFLLCTSNCYTLDIAPLQI